jgi:hypothetical protein
MLGSSFEQQDHSRLTASGTRHRWEYSSSDQRIVFASLQEQEHFQVSKGLSLDGAPEGRS